MTNESESEFGVGKRGEALLQWLTAVRRRLVAFLRATGVVRLLVVVRSSFLAFVTAMGVLFLLVAVVLSAYVPGIHHGVLSAMFAVWGASAFLYAVAGHLGLRLIGYR